MWYETGVSKGTLYKFLRKYKLNIPNYHNRLKFDNSVFDSIDSDEKSYWLGFLYADGFVNGKYNNSVELSLSSIDIGHLYKYNQFLKNEGTIVVSKSSKKFRKM